MVEILVNGKSVAKRLWDPYKADLSGYLVDGTNTLELRVTSTYSNFLYKGTPSGIGGVRLFTERITER